MNKSLLLFTFLNICIIQTASSYSLDELLTPTSPCHLLHKSRERVLKLENYELVSYGGIFTASILEMVGAVLLSDNINNKVFYGSLFSMFLALPVLVLFDLLKRHEISKASEMFVHLAAIRRESGQFMMSDEDFVFLGKKATHFSNETLRYIAHKLGRNIPNL